MSKQRIWIGGSPCSGKSTLAHRLGKVLNLPVYHADTFFSAHAAQAPPNSVSARIHHWSPEQIFMRDVHNMLATFVTLGHEEFPIILADLNEEHWQNGFVIEGCALLPELVAKTVSKADNVLYLIPTDEFQRFHYAQRPWIDNILKQTSDPAKAWENWRIRDAWYSKLVKKQALNLGFPVICIDKQTNLDDVYKIANTNVNPKIF